MSDEETRSEDFGSCKGLRSMSQVFLGMLLGGALGCGYGLWLYDGPSNAGNHDNYGAVFLAIAFELVGKLLASGFFTIVGGIIGASIGLILDVWKRAVGVSNVKPRAARQTRRTGKASAPASGPRGRV